MTLASLVSDSRNSRDPSNALRMASQVKPSFAGGDDLDERCRPIQQ